MATSSQISGIAPLHDQISGARAPRHGGLQATRFVAGESSELREQFTQFVGETFYGQMLKAMRATVGKPAYFHGGRAEEVFQGQVDQNLVEQLTEATAAKFSEPMFARQFPHLAREVNTSELNQLTNLRRM